MKLFEHRDFEQAIIRATEHFRGRGLREALIEKDYYVTEALRIIERAVGPKVIFKGGTSLSKGWNLIQRFSEDIDIFLDPTAFDPPLGKKAIDREESGTSLGADDEGAFEMRLLHFRRTFVEKMFAIHAKVEAFKEEGREIGGYARHYYDLFCLAERPEVVAMLRSAEYGAIKDDYDRISLEHFEKSYVPPPDMSFAKSDALFPAGQLRDIIGKIFAEQCNLLYFGHTPSWEEVEYRLNGIRDLL
jgi:hypothetical protein